MSKYIPAGDISFLIIFGLAIVTRAVLSSIPNVEEDLTWVTTFAAIAAVWVSNRQQIQGIGQQAKKIERNTNGGVERARLEGAADGWKAAIDTVGTRIEVPAEALSTVETANPYQVQLDNRNT
jgi:hypothetical protein